MALRVIVLCFSFHSLQNAIYITFTPHYVMLLYLTASKGNSSVYLFFLALKYCVICGDNEPIIHKTRQLEIAVASGITHTYISSLGYYNLAQELI